MFSLLFFSTVVYPRWGLISCLKNNSDFYNEELSMRYVNTDRSRLHNKSAENEQNNCMLVRMYRWLLK